MLYSILPKKIVDILSVLCNMDKLYEIRLRASAPVVVCYDSRYFYLTVSGLSRVPVGAIMVDAKGIEDVVYKAADYSLYTATKQINCGYITISGGIRIGIAGDVVWDGNDIRAVKNFQAINIRIPHEVNGCSDSVFDYIVQDGRVHNTLIISPPAAGKTTLLRDISRRLSSVYPLINTLVIDERSEIAAVYNGSAKLDVGINTDVISNCSKAVAFGYAVRSMRPDVIVTDELASNEDLDAIGYALSSGINAIASVHGRTVADLANKFDFDKIIKTRIIERFVVLSSSRGVGTVDGIYNELLDRLDNAI